MAPRSPAPLPRMVLSGPLAGRAAALQAASRALQYYAPPIPEPPPEFAYVPIAGGAWQAGHDLQQGDYNGAVFNGANAALEAVPAGVGVKGLITAIRVNKALGGAKRTAKAVQNAFHEAKLATPIDEVHHVFPLNGIPRDVENWRNSLAFMKPMPKANHRRWHGRWGGQPKFGPLSRAWHGTTDWMKAVPTGLAAYGADSIETARRSPGPDKRKP